MTNPSTATATVLVAALVDCGVTDVVLSPGSRNAALSLALATAEEAGTVRLHVRVDERSAAFLALGLAKRSRRPTPVIVTSGTAAVELSSAMVEASYSGIPLMAITADRPAELRGTGASQTIVQPGMYGPNVRFEADLPAPEMVAAHALRLLQSTVGRAVAAAIDPFDPGPVHLNVAFRDPLVPTDSITGDDLVEAACTSPAITVDARLAAMMALPADEALSGLGDIPARGAVILGDPIDDESREAGAALAEACGWPLIVEPSGLPEVDSDALIAHASVLVADAGFRAEHRCDLVITVGRVGLSRGVLRLVAEAGAHVVVDPRPAVRWADPLRTASFVLGAVPEPPEQMDAFDPAWLASWRAAADAAEDVVSAALDVDHTLTGPAVARLLMAVADPDGVVLVGSSWPVRHVEAFAFPRERMPLVVGNRGCAGIDGLVSTAWGVALAHGEERPGTAYALMGDLSFLYDVNGLLVGPHDARPNLVIVVIDNDGGGIFSSLEQGDEWFADRFERVFGTPHGRDLVGVASAYDVPATRVDTPHEFLAALDDAAVAGGVHVIVASTGPRSDEARLLTDITEAVREAVN